MLTIGKLSKATGVKVPTIRYYEQIGLMAAPIRSAGNQRHYDRAAQDRLGFIRHARDLGFPLEAIRELLGLSDDPHGACAVADDIARRQLAAVEARIARLTVLRDEKEVKESGGLVTPFAERQRLVGKPEWDALEKRYT